jgi:arylsulfatase A-like enzyme
MGFWNHPTPGVRTPSKEWMTSLLGAQKEGKAVDDPSRLRLDAGEITRKHPEDRFPGHAAWLDWPWKLHRIEKDDHVMFELYNLADDPQERENLIEQAPERAEAMRLPLEVWLVSVVRSLNGADYK